MKNFVLKMLLLSSLSVFHMASEGFAAESDYYEVVGEVAQDFSLKGSDGKLHTLSEHAGKIVVLEWFNKKCPLDTMLYDHNVMQYLQKKYSDEGVVWYMVSSTADGKMGYLSNMEAKSVFNEETGAGKEALLLDRAGELARAYQVDKVPYVAVINAQGSIVYIGAMNEVGKSRDNKGVLSVYVAKDYVGRILDDLLSDTPVSMVYNKPKGCSLKR